MSKTFISIFIISIVLVVGGIWFFAKDSGIESITSTSSSEIKVDNAVKEIATSTNDLKNTTSDNEINKKYMNATLHTNKGDITIEFKSSGVPNTVANFIKLAGEKFYDGVKFHRVIKDFMIQ